MAIHADLNHFSAIVAWDCRTLAITIMTKECLNIAPSATPAVLAGTAGKFTGEDPRRSSQGLRASSTQLDLAKLSSLRKRMQASSDGSAFSIVLPSSASAWSFASRSLIIDGRHLTQQNSTHRKPNGTNLIRAEQDRRQYSAGGGIQASHENSRGRFAVCYYSKNLSLLQSLSESLYVISDRLLCLTAAKRTTQLKPQSVAAVMRSKKFYSRSLLRTNRFRSTKV